MVTNQGSRRLETFFDVNWGYDGTGPRELTEHILKHFQQEVPGLKQGAVLHSDVANAVLARFVKPVPLDAEGVTIRATDVAATVMTKFPHLVDGGPAGTMLSTEARREQAFVSRERTTLGEVRQQVERDGSLYAYLGQGWRTSRDLSSYAVTCVVDAADTVTVYAAEAGLVPVGRFAPDGSDFPADTEVLMLGRSRIEWARDDNGERQGDLSWLSDIRPAAGAGDLDVLIAAVEFRSVLAKDKRAEMTERLPYPYTVRQSEFLQTHLSNEVGDETVPLSQDLSDASGKTFNLAWSSASGYLFAVERPDATHQSSRPEPKVVVLGRFSSNVELDWAIGDALAGSTSAGGLERVTEAARVNALVSQSPFYACGVKGPIEPANRRVEPTLS